MKFNIPTRILQSYVNNSDEWRPIASLFIVDMMNRTYVLDASESNRSNLNLINAPGASSSAPIATSTNDTIPVKLSVLFDGRPYCATYNPDPPAPEPLTMDPCNDDSSPVSHKSQIFLYNGKTGAIRPTWFQAEDDGTANTQDGVSSFSSSATPSATPGIASPSAGANLASWSRRDDTAYPANSTYEQNVTLVFIPQRAAANNAAINASVSTSTYTQTVTVYSSGSPSSLNAAEATPSTTNSSVPAASATGLNVEVVGSGPSSPFAGSTYVSSSAPAAAASGSLNAADIGASIAASYSASSASAFASSSAFVVASASGSSDIASASPSVTPTFVAAILERDSAGELTPVGTDPYLWRFRSDRK